MIYRLANRLNNYLHALCCWDESLNTISFHPSMDRPYLPDALPIISALMSLK